MAKTSQATVVSRELTRMLCASMQIHHNVTITAGQGIESWPVARQRACLTITFRNGGAIDGWRAGIPNTSDLATCDKAENVSHALKLTKSI
jgi:hypothetical protein